MSPGFQFTGPLDPDSLLFQGRKKELARLKAVCQNANEPFQMVLGSRRAGKTSLLLKLKSQLPESAHTTWINFQLIKRTASIDDVTRFIALRIAREENVPLPDTLSFPAWLAAQIGAGTHVLLMEELGQLVKETRDDLANLLRATYSERQNEKSFALRRFNVILFGGIELHELGVADNSRLKSVCDPRHIYLEDLKFAETHSLMNEGMKGIDSRPEEIRDMAHQIHFWSDGFPGLTQYLAHLYMSYWQDNAAPPDEGQINEMVHEVLNKDAFFVSIFEDIKECRLERACRLLLTDKSPFTRVNGEMARLELIGAAKPGEKVWQARNRLFSEGLSVWLGDESRDMNDQSGKGENMDPTSLLLTALLSGLASGLSESATTMFKDLITKLKKRLESKGKEGKPAKAVLEQIESDPRQLPGKPELEEKLKSGLQESGLVVDDELVRLAQAVMAAIDPQGTRNGSYNVTVNRVGSGVGSINATTVNIYQSNTSSSSSGTEG